MIDYFATAVDLARAADQEIREGRMDRYILNAENEPEPCPDLMTWGRWFENNGAQRRVALDALADDVRVSTVFLGLDHNFQHGEPVLWETMIFGGPHDGWQDRYTSHAAAIFGHQKAVELARSGLVPLVATGTET